MVIVHMQGGLGNQLFQYAFGRAIAARSGARLLFDMDFFDLAPGDHTARTYGLDAFGLHCERATPEQIAVARQRGSMLRARLHGLHPRLAPDRSVKERGFTFDPRMLEVRGDAYFSGYWQSPRYFAGIEQALREQVTLRLPLPDRLQGIAARIAVAGGIGVHVRRGDYISNPHASAHFVPCDAAYYAAATRMLRAEAPDTPVFIFSDDMAWAREHVPVPGEVHHVQADPHDHPAMHLHLMAMCQHQVIANSSFSWWAAWLNQHPGRRVIAPKRWFTDPSMDTRDLIPSDWIRL